jgi:hypothetical protein
VIPTFYEILTEWRDWIFDHVRGRRPVQAHGHAPRREPPEGEPEPV